MQGGKGIFDSLCHGIYFVLLGNVFTTDNGIDSRFYCGEVFVIILLQSICLGEGCINLGVVGLLILQGSNRIFDSLCHGIDICLLCQLLSSNHQIDCSLHSGEVLVVVLVQCICLGNGCVYCTVICQAILKLRIIARLRKRIAQ